MLSLLSEGIKVKIFVTTTLFVFCVGVKLGVMSRVKNKGCV
jgi:hypothetical protein